MDIIVKTPKEIEAAMKGGAVNGFFIREMAKKGKILYGKRKFLGLKQQTIHVIARSDSDEAIPKLRGDCFGRRTRAPSQ